MEVGKHIPKQRALAEMAVAMAASGWLGWGAPLPRLDPQRFRHGIMRPDLATLKRWEGHRRAGLPAHPPRTSSGGTGATSPGTSAPPPATFSLLSYLPSPTLRDQGDCGSCWVWAGTGMAEIALKAQYGLSDRLSIQYFQSNETTTWACDAGDLTEFCDWYDNNPDVRMGANPNPGVMVPWSNAQGAYADGAVNQYQLQSTVAPGAVGVHPQYQGLTLTRAPVQTTGVAQATAIANLTAALNNHQAVGFSFFTNFDAAANGFYTFWDDQPETSLWLNAFEGATWNSSDPAWGGHMVMIIGYDTTASTPYWICQNQWGTPTGRPDGQFLMPMAMNYGATFTYAVAGGNPEVLSCYGFETLTLTTPGNASPAGTPAAPAGGFAAATDTALTGQVLSLVPAFTAGSPPFSYQWSVTHGAGPAVTLPSWSEVLALPNDAVPDTGALDSTWQGATAALTVTNGAGSATFGPFTLDVAGSVLNADSGFETAAPATGWAWTGTTLVNPIQGSGPAFGGSAFALLTGEGLAAGNAGTLTSVPVALPSNAATPVYATYYLQMATRETLPMALATCTLQVVDAAGKLLRVLKTHTNMDVDHLAYLPETFDLTSLNQGGTVVSLQAVWSDPDAATAFRLDDVQLQADSGSAQPTLTAFTPAQGAPGTTVTLTGSHFTGATGVVFGRNHANSLTGVSDTQLKAVVPWDGATGPLTVTGPAGTIASTAPFQVAPSFISNPASYGFQFGSSLTEMTPTKGAPDATVKLVGLNFTGATAVTLGGAAATFTVNSNTQITAAVPAGATSGPFAVTTPGGTATTVGSFTVTGTTATLTVTPASATAGSVVTLTGAGFLTLQSVSFNNLPLAANAITVQSDTSLLVQVPSGPSSGTVSVTTAGGTVTGVFTVLAPSVATPPAGTSGALLAVTGSGFLDVTTVTFNGVVIKTFTVADNSHLSFLVPGLAQGGSYALSVTSPEGTSPSVSCAVTVPAVPASAGFSPSSGDVGTTVTVTGQYLTGTTSVTLNGVGAPFVIVSDTQITFTVPATAGTGPVAVTTHSGLWTSQTSFHVDVQVVLVQSPDGLLAGSTFPFQVQVKGDPLAGVTWRVQEGLAGGTVTTAGLYTAPALTGLYHVVATSTLDSTASATAPVQVHGAAISGGVAGTAPVSVADLACLMAAYGTAAGDPRFNVLADLNGDGVIDDQDLVLFLKAFP